MTSVLFEAQLGTALASRPITFSCILFGADSLAQKEQRFRLMCQHKYPSHHLIGAVVTRPMTLLSPTAIAEVKVN